MVKEVMMKSVSFLYTYNFYVIFASSLIWTSHSFKLMVAFMCIHYLDLIIAAE